MHVCEGMYLRMYTYIQTYQAKGEVLTAGIAQGTASFKLAVSGYYLLGTHFTCSTGTIIQILTQKALLACRNSEDVLWDVLQPYGPQMAKFLGCLALVTITLYLISSLNAVASTHDLISAGIFFVYHEICIFLNAILLKSA